VFAAEICRQQSNAGFLGHAAQKSTAPGGNKSSFRTAFQPFSSGGNSPTPEVEQPGAAVNATAASSQRAALLLPSHRQ